jgi:hypothetical protein
MAVAEERLDRFEQKFNVLVKEKHDRVNGRVDTCEEKHDALRQEVHDHYVSKAMLTLHLANISQRYDDMLSDFKWLRRFIAAGFLAALAQYVYVRLK